MSNKIIALFAMVVLVSGLVAGGLWLNDSGPGVRPQHEGMAESSGGSGGCC